MWYLSALLDVAREANVPLPSPTPEEIKAFRREAGNQTQSRLAELLGVSRRTIEEWEAGRNPPPAFLRLAFSAMAGELQPWGVPLSEIGVQRLNEARARAAASEFKIRLHDFGDKIGVQGDAEGELVLKSSIDGSATALLGAVEFVERMAMERRGRNGHGPPAARPSAKGA